MASLSGLLVPLPCCCAGPAASCSVVLRASAFLMSRHHSSLFCKAGMHLQIRQNTSHDMKVADMSITHNGFKGESVGFCGDHVLHPHRRAQQFRMLFIVKDKKQRA